MEQNILEKKPTMKQKTQDFLPSLIVYLPIEQFRKEGQKRRKNNETKQIKCNFSLSLITHLLIEQFRKDERTRSS